MTKFRTKPVVIEAIEWTGENLREIIDFTGQNNSAYKWTWEEFKEVMRDKGQNNSAYKWTWEEFKEVVRDKGLKIFTLEGAMTADIGDWIIKEEAGESYPCKPSIFDKTYELVPEPRFMYGL